MTAAVPPFAEIRSTRGTPSGRWFRTRPDVFREEFSRPRFVAFLVILIIGVVLCVLAYMDPEHTVDALQRGRRRDGIAVIFGFAAPPVVVLFGAFGMWRWAKRWRAIGSGPMGSSTVRKVSAAVDIPAALAELRRCSGQPNRFAEVYAGLPEDPNGPVNFFTMQTTSSDVLSIVVSRNLSDAEAREKGEYLIEYEPVLFRGDEAFDAFAVLHPGLKQK